VLEQVVANYSSAGIPLDCLWLDIEYMGNRFKTLTFDESKWRWMCPCVAYERSACQLSPSKQSTASAMDCSGCAGPQWLLHTN
jgi:hypothetical protein